MKLRILFAFGFALSVALTIASRDVAADVTCFKHCGCGTPAQHEGTNIDWTCGQSVCYWRECSNSMGPYGFSTDDPAQATMIRIPVRGFLRAAPGLSR